LVEVVTKLADESQAKEDALCVGTRLVKSLKYRDGRNIERSRRCKRVRDVRRFAEMRKHVAVWSGWAQEVYDHSALQYEVMSINKSPSLQEARQSEWGWIAATRYLSRRSW
jgi:hypothetical protein